MKRYYFLYNSSINKFPLSQIYTNQLKPRFVINLLKSHIICFANLFLWICLFRAARITLEQMFFAAALDTATNKKNPRATHSNQWVTSDMKIKGFSNPQNGSRRSVNQAAATRNKHKAREFIVFSPHSTIKCVLSWIFFWSNSVGATWR